jgi:hypothetical protein
MPKLTRREMWAVTITVIAILIGKVAYATIAYGDPYCAFARCVKVK